MKSFSFKSILSFCIIALLALASPARGDEDNAGAFANLKKMYEDLPDQGKFVTGAVVGYAGSRFAVRSATAVVKVAGAVFVATEALNAAGVLDEEADITAGLQQRALVYANNFRKAVRERLNPDSIRFMMKKDRMATMGVAAGAFVGFLR